MFLKILGYFLNFDTMLKKKGQFLIMSETAGKCFISIILIWKYVLGLFVIDHYLMKFVENQVSA